MQLSFSAVRAEIFSGYKILFVVLFITYFNKNKTEVNFWLFEARKFILNETILYHKSAKFYIL